VTGGNVLVMPPSDGRQSPEDAEEPEEMAPELEVQPVQSNPDEWTGYTDAFNNDEVETFTAKTKDDWKKLWKIISSEKAPGVDFKEKMIIGIAAGRNNRADTVRILSQRPGEDGLKVDYYMIKAEEGKDTPFWPYIFKIVGKVEGKVEYKRLDVDK